MKFLRTPDERFQNLPGYPFAPHYASVPDEEGGILRMHYVDEGPRHGAVVLMLHGEPTWSYLYRKMIPGIVAAGFRAIAPDLIGFGKSDKPTERSDYTYARHVGWMWAFIQELALRDINLMCQDWGSLIGLRVVGEHPEFFARILVANGGMPTGDQKMSDAFLGWLEFSQKTPVFPIGSLVAGGSVTPLSKEVIAAYDAPFPDDTYKAGARQFPILVPISREDPAASANLRAWEVLKQWNKPLLTAFSDKDPITRGGDAVFQRLVPGAKNQPHTTIDNGGHFLQEDQGEELARIVVDFVRRSA
jgi:haloalkane dehalogenase